MKSLFCVSSCRKVRDAGPGEPAARRQSDGAVGRHGGVGLLYAARGHQPQHGERQSFSRQRRHREAGGHQQRTRERVRNSRDTLCPMLSLTFLEIVSCCII